MGAEADSLRFSTIHKLVLITAAVTAICLLTAVAVSDDGSEATVGDTYIIDGISYRVLSEDPYNVSVVSSAYSGDITIPSTFSIGGNTYNVSSISGTAFTDCTGLRSISIPDSVSVIRSNTFSGCSSLMSVTIPSSMSLIEDDAFKNCTMLKEVVNRSSLTIEKYSDSNGGVAKYALDVHSGDSKMFYHVFELSTYSFLEISGEYSLIHAGIVSDNIRLPLEFNDGIHNVATYIVERDAFRSCTSFSYITVPGIVTSFNDDAFGTLRFYEPDGIELIPSYNVHGYRYQNDGTKLIKTSVANILRYDENGGDVSIPRLYADETTLIEYPGTNGLLYFIGWASNTYTYFPGANYAIYGEKTLRAVWSNDYYTTFSTKLSNGSTGTFGIFREPAGNNNGQVCVLSCTSILGKLSFDTEIFYNGLAYDIIAIRHDSFKNRTDINTVILPDDLRYVEYNAFSGCTNLLSVTIPSSIKNIGDNAFKDCIKLIEIVNRSTLELSAGSDEHGLIAKNAIEVNLTQTCQFTYVKGTMICIFAMIDNVCNLIHAEDSSNEIILPHASDLSIETISSYVIFNYAFYNSSSLKRVTFSVSVTEIGEQSFTGCSSLNSLLIPGSVCKIASNAFDLITFYDMDIPAILSYDQLPGYSYKGFSGIFVRSSPIFKVDYDINGGSVPLFSSPSEKEYYFPEYAGTKTDLMFVGWTDNTDIFYPGQSYTLGTDMTFVALWGPSEDQFFEIQLMKDTFLKYKLITEPFGSFKGRVSLFSYSGTLPQCLLIDDTVFDNSIEYVLWSISPDAFKDCTDISSISFPDTIKSIGTDAFSSCNFYDTDGKTHLLPTADNLSGHDFIGTISTKMIKGEIIPVSFYDGELIDIVGFNKGQTVDKFNVNVEREPTVYYTYQVTGWNDEDSVPISFPYCIDHILSVTPVIEPVLRSYEIQMISENNELSRVQFHAGTIVDMAAFGIPVKESSRAYDYTFYKWNTDSDGNGLNKSYFELLSDLKLYAVFTSTPRNYSITYLDENGDIIEVREQSYGSKITTISCNDKVLGSTYHSFNGWDGAYAGMILTDDLTFRAKYERSPIFDPGNAVDIDFSHQDHILFTEDNISELKGRMTNGDVSLNVHLQNGSIQFNDAAIRKISSKGYLSLTSVKDKDDLSLNEKIKRSDIYNLSFDSNTSFGGGIVKVTIPYTIPAGSDSSNLYVYDLMSDSSPKKVFSTYDGENITFITDSTSLYAVSLEELSVTQEDTKNDPINIAVIIVSAAVIIALFCYGRFRY